MDDEKCERNQADADRINRYSDKDKPMTEREMCDAGQGTEHLQWDYFETKPLCTLKDFKTKAFKCKVEDETKLESELEIPELVKQMKLTEYFPGKLTIDKALEINTRQQSAHVEELPWDMLKTIISANFRFRETIMDEYNTKIRQTKSVKESEDTNLNLFTLSSDSDSESESIDEDNSLNWHPLDVLLVLYVCCDPHLKALVAQKLFACKLAIPFIYNDFLINENIVLSLWPIRGILTTTENHTEESIVTQNTNIVSFIRLGNPGKQSKSKFINGIMREESEIHNTFFHRDCRFGTFTRTLSEGMVEISWYLPSENSDVKVEESAKCQFQSQLTVLNLRGNAAEYGMQTNAILTMSKVVVVFIAFDDIKNETFTDILTKIHASGAYVILCTRVNKDIKVIKKVLRRFSEVTGADMSKTCLFSTFDLGLKREYNACEMKERLIKIISDELKNSEASVSLESITENLSVVHLDEKDQTCSNGKKLANSVFLHITRIKQISQRKNTILPLQGDCLWRKWAKLQKEDKRSIKNVNDEQRNSIWKEMNDIRKRQVTVLNSSPNVTARFVEILIDNIDDSEVLRYFLAWLKYLVDAESRRILPELRKRLQSAFNEHEAEKSNKQKEIVGEAKENKQTEQEVELAKRNLENASLNLEHIYRELGQIFEAFKEGKYSEKERKFVTGSHISNNTLLLLDILPYLAVKLLLLGQPLEIMDGDASNVPQSWIQAVFMALHQVLENKKLVSVSVLGLQSSGKSTLLNTMFGLQFSVSAGRCTRGAFLQVLPILSDKSQNEPSFIAVVDTEGLRAPEVSGNAVSCDNELATLVIGLTDVIILNIKGETMGEMENVLQIVVHELLRLKQAHANLELCQSVILVHQNVSAQDAASHLAQGNLSIVANLNKVTKEAALQTCMSGIECFKDVIQLNSKDHVKYISDLWLGNPPMAPVNPKYCAQAQEVADAIFKDLVRNQEQFLSMENFLQHLNDLWKAILAEDFVFSFSNGLQIKAYILLEREFLTRKWQLESLKMEWEERNITPKLKECPDELAITDCAVKLIRDFSDEIARETTNVIEILDKFLRSSELRQQMVDWQESKKQRLKDIADELHRSVQRNIKTVENQCKHALKKDAVFERRKKCIHEMATAIAKKMMGKQPTEEEKIQNFEEFWRKEVLETELDVSEESIESRKKRIKIDLKSLVYDQYRAQGLLIGKEFERCPLAKQIDRLESSLNDIIHEEHIITENKTSFKTFLKTNKETNSSQQSENSSKAQGLPVVNSILKDIDNYFSMLLKTDTDYDKTHFSKVLQLIKNAFDLQNESSNIKLSPALEILVSVQAARYAYNKFQALSSQYQKNHSIKMQLDEYRPRAWQLFNDVISEKTNEIIAANGFVFEIKGMLQERIQRHLPNAIVSKVQVEKFANQKHALIKIVLEDLTEKDFQKLHHYISKPASYVREWLEEFTNETVFKGNGDQSFYFKEARDYLSRLIRKVRSAMITLASQNRNQTCIGVWIKEFKSLIKEENFIMKADAFEDVAAHDITSFEEFSNCVQDQLSVIEKEVSQIFENHTPQTIRWPKETPYQVIFENLWGCTESCPFCHEPCINSDKHHAESQNDFHRCIQHRPTGIAGWYNLYTGLLDLDSCSYGIHKDKLYHCEEWCNCDVIKRGGMCFQYHKGREYKKYQPKWEIFPNTDHPSSKYWAWCMCHFSEQLEEKHGHKLPELPASWTHNTKQEAVESLNMYQ